MADTVSSTLTIKLNARELNTLPAILKKVFAPGPARELTTASKDVTKALRENLDTATKLVTQMGQVAKGTAEYKKLQTALRDVNTEGRALEQTLHRVEAATERAARRGGGFGGLFGGRGRGGGAGGGGGGMAGLPGVQAPGLTAGALTTGLGAIPLAGALAAGSVMSAFQSYGSHVALQEQIMQANPFLGRYRDAQTVTTTRNDFAPLSPGERDYAMRELGSGKLREWGKGLGDTASNTILGANSLMGPLGIAIGTPGRALARAAGAKLGEATGGSGLASPTGRSYYMTAAMVGGQDFAEGELRGAIGAPTSKMQVTTSSTVRPPPFDANAYYGRAISMGYKPQEAIALASQMAQAAGRRVGPEEAEFGMAAQRAFGLDVGTTGGLMRGMRYMGGEDSPEGIAKLIGLQVAKGLEGSELNEALQQQAAFMEAQAEQGRTFSMGGMGMAGAEMGLINAGVAAHRAGAITQAFTGGVAARGAAGPTSAVDIRMMRAMGINLGGGREEYARGALAMQDPDKVADALPAYLNQFRSEGFGPEFQTMLLQRSLGAYGANVGPDDARALAGGMARGDAQATEDVRSILKRAKAFTPGTMATEAGFEAQRAGVGATMAKSVQDLTQATINMGKAAGEFNVIIGAVTGNFETLSEKLIEVSDTLGAIGAAGLGLSP